MDSLVSFSAFLHSCISPIALISGVGLILLSCVGIVLSAIFLFVDVRLTLKALEFEVRPHI